MILGKRPRPPIKRTTSMTEFTLDLNPTAVVSGGTNTNAPQSSPYDDPNNPFNVIPPTDADGNHTTLDRRLLLTTTTAVCSSPRNHRRNSADLGGTPHFLTLCCLCNRRLISGRDIFMYRGDSAFCSFECRQEQMNQDEKKDRRSLITKKPVIDDSECSSNSSKRE